MASSLNLLSVFALLACIQLYVCAPSKLYGLDVAVSKRGFHMGHHKKEGKEYYKTCPNPTEEEYCHEANFELDFVNPETDESTVVECGKFFPLHKISMQTGDENNRRDVAPKVTLFGSQPGTFYTLLMFDPDAPGNGEENDDNNYLCSWMHWLVVNIEDDVTKGDVIAGFQRSGPPIHSGQHRYSFFLMRQKEKIDVEQNKVLQALKIRFSIPILRAGFSVAKFLDEMEYCLQDISSTFYRTEYEAPAERKKKDSKDIIADLEQIKSFKL